MPASQIRRYRRIGCDALAYVFAFVNDCVRASRKVWKDHRTKRKRIDRILVHDV